jgi:hypothetical protein
MVWVAGVALSLITMLPVWAPRAVGLKVMVIAQRAPAASEVPQVLVSAKLPLGTMLVMLRAVVVLVLRRVTFAPALIEPSATLPNERDVGDRVTTCECAVSIAAAIRKKTQDTRSTRVGIGEKRNRGLIRPPENF